MELESDFVVFLSEIRPTKNQRDERQAGHKTLREKLRADEELMDVLVSDFLQGSYRRATAVRPKGDSRSDVDIIVVTRLAENEYTPTRAMAVFKPFLDRHYEGKWHKRDRSIEIKLSYVNLDLVVTSAPSEAEFGILSSDAVISDQDLEEARDWRLHGAWVSLSSRDDSDARRRLAEAKSQDEWQAKPLRIPDREAREWDWTHPLEQIRWTRDKNARTNGHFVNVVKAIKWWRLENFDEPEHPKGFPLERLIGQCCRDGIESVAEGVAKTLEMMVTEYAEVVAAGGKPWLPDYGVPSHDVFSRVSAQEFQQFFEQVVSAAAVARRALDSDDAAESGKLWRQLLGSKFPKPPENGGSQRKGYTPPRGPAVPGSGRFA